MEVVLIIAGLILLIIGIIGCFAPVIPGPLVAYGAILLRHFCSNKVFYSTELVIILGILMVAITIIDYSKVNIDGLKAIDGVMGVIEDETLQVVIGPGTVNKVAQAMVDTVGVKLGETFPAAANERLENLVAKTKSESKEKYNKSL